MDHEKTISAEASLKKQAIAHLQFLKNLKICSIRGCFENEIKSDGFLPVGSESQFSGAEKALISTFEFEDASTPTFT